MVRKKKTVEILTIITQEQKVLKNHVTVKIDRKTSKTDGLVDDMLTLVLSATRKWEKNIE